jgi:two-component system sensor histidine kinase MtrB
MVTITLLASSTLVGAFGFLVVQRTTDDLLRGARLSADAEVAVGVDHAQRQLDFHTQRDDEQGLLRTMRDIMTTLERGGVTVALTSHDGSLRVTSPVTASFQAALTPDLRAAVAQAQQASQIVTARTQPDAEPVTYLVYGRPVPTQWGDQFELYYLYPLTTEASLAADVRRTVLVTGVPLVLLLVVVTGLVTRLVVRPVRTASRTAQRLSAGLLDQRMVVHGEDDLALLAASFNQMAENLQRQIVRLEEMSRLQRRFTSDVSHELRTPLTTVRMAADLIFAERAAYPPEVARSAELLQHELNRFETLLTDLLEISRFDAGFAALDGEPTDLVPVVRRTLERLHTVAARARVNLRVTVPDGPVIAEVDPRRIERVLRNLVDNAIEHGEGGPVEVTLAGSEAAAAVTVRDYGAGLRAGEEKLVFNRFWRADPSRARHTGGTGLGLAISLEDMRLHGGWLEAWGAPGRGAQFRLTVPLHAGDRLTGSPLPLVPADAGQRPAGPPEPAPATAAPGPDAGPAELARTRSGP